MAAQFESPKQTGSVLCAESNIFVLALNPIALRKAKIVYNFGLSECNRVNSRHSYELHIVFVQSMHFHYGGLTNV